MKKIDHLILLVTIDTLRYDEINYLLLKDTSEFVALEKVFSSGPSTPFAFPGLFASCYASEYNLSVPTLAEILKSIGYLTFGHNGGNVYCSDVWGYERGFDYFADRFKGRNVSDLSPFIPSYIDVIKEFFNWFYKQGEVKKIDKIFTWLHLMDLHGRWDHFDYLDNRIRKMASNLFQGYTRPEKRFNERELSDYKKLRKEILEHLKNGVIDIVEFAKLHSKNYIVILTSDHGEELMEHENIDHLPKLYDELLHVPFLVCTNIREIQEKMKKASNKLISLIDLPAMLVSISGAKQPLEWQGINFLETNRKFIYAESFRQEASFRHDPRIKGVKNYCVRTLKWKYMLLNGKELFFDLDKDPEEMRPVEVPEKVKDYVRSIGKSILKNKLKITQNKFVKIKKENNVEKRLSDLLSKLRNGEFNEVVEVLENLNEKTDRDYVALGLAYHGLQKSNKAIGMWKKALNINPDNLDALFNLAHIYYEMRKWNKLREVALKYFNNDPKNWEINDILCDLYTFEGHFEKAMFHLEKVAKKVSQDMLSQVVKKMNLLKEKAEIAKAKPRLAFICTRGLDNFIDEIITNLSEEYWVKKFAIVNDVEIYSAIDWADIVWFEWANKAAVIGSNYPGIEGKRAVVRLHRYEAFTGFPRQINWENIDKLFLVSHTMKKVLEKYHPGIENKVEIKIIYNGLDLEKIPFKKRSKGYNIAWVAYVNPRKNAQLALQIIKKLVAIDKRYKLHIAGSFDDLSMELYLKYIGDEMGLQNNVIFYGWVDDMEEWWKDKNYVLSTSIHEAHPYNIMEAMARGIKPVIHNFFGAKELYEKRWIFNDIEEACRIITEGAYDSSYYRNFVQTKGWTLEGQVSAIKKEIKSLIRGALEKKSTVRKTKKVDLNDLKAFDNYMKYLLKTSEKEYMTSLERFILESKLPIQTKIEYYQYSLYREMRNYERFSYISETIPDYFYKAGERIFSEFLKDSNASKKKLFSKNKIKVGFLLNGLDYFQIIFRYLFEAAIASKNSKFEYHFVSLIPESSFRNAEFAKNVLNKYNMKFFIPRSKNTLHRGSEVINYINKEKLDVIVVQSFYLIPLMMVMYPVLRKIVPAIGKWITQDLEEYFLDKVDFLMFEMGARDNLIKRELKKTKLFEFSYAVNKSIIENSVDIRKYYELPKNSEIVISIGRSVKYMNNDFWKLVINLLENIDKDLRFVFIGPDKKSVGQFIPKNYLMNKKIILHGPDLEGRRFLKSSNYYINSFPNGSGVSFVEAYYAELPIISFHSKCRKKVNVHCKSLYVPMIYYNNAEKFFPYYDYEKDVCNIKELYEVACKIITDEIFRKEQQENRKVPKSQMTYDYFIKSFEKFVRDNF